MSAQLGPIDDTTAAPPRPARLTTARGPVEWAEYGVGPAELALPSRPRRMRLVRPGRVR